MPEQLTAPRPLDPSDLVAALDEMRAHDIRLFACLTADELQDRLALTPPALPVKIRTPLCLSHHPQNPATPEEVAALARPSP